MTFYYACVKSVVDEKDVCGWSIPVPPILQTCPRHEYNLYTAHVMITYRYDLVIFAVNLFFLLTIFGSHNIYTGIYILFAENVMYKLLSLILTFFL